MIPVIRLEDLPLRPSTLTLFQQRGFRTTVELEESKKGGGGMANLAAELNVPITRAATLIREVEGCLYRENTTATATATATANNNRNGNGNGEDENDDYEAYSLLSSSSSSAGPFAMYTASELLQASTPRRGNIVTFCKSIDEMLGGGIELGQVTEIAGMPGTGKTQMAMQLCVDARLPQALGGVEGQAIYIDAEGSFSPERCHSMAEALVKHTQATIQRLRRRHLQQQQAQQQAQQQQPFTLDEQTQSFTSEQILDGIHVYRVFDEAAQTSTLYSLTNFIEQQQQHEQTTSSADVVTSSSSTLPIKLIVLDSIAFHYRSIVVPQQDSKKYYIQRTQALTQLASYLSQIATAYNLAVVIINQMTTKFDNTNNSTGNSSSSSNYNNQQHGTARHVPALGESWAHATTTRLLLSSSPNNGGASSAVAATAITPTPPHESSSAIPIPITTAKTTYTCSLVKSPHRPAGKAQYAILDVGIRGIEYQHTTSTTASSSSRTTAASSSSAQQAQQQQQQSYASLGNSGPNESNHNKRMRTYY